MGERRCPSCSRCFAPELMRCPVDGALLVSGAGAERSPAGGSEHAGPEGDPYLGLTVASDFRLDELIGTGSMGRVYRARQLSMARDVAIKILHRELLASDTLIKRFHQEAKVTSRLSHPSVIQVYLTGTLPQLSARVGGEAYLVMEHLDGVSLEAALTAAGGALPLARALHILLQVSDAVGEAHAQQIVHRDLKPENVMLVRRGADPDFAKVLDFGVARADLGEDSIATHTGAVFGSARYVSPEGARGERVGPPADVYSLATLLFRCLAGQTPFSGDNPVAVLIQHSNRPAPDITSFERCRTLPAPLAQVIAKNLAKQPEAREPNGRAFAEALARAIQASAHSEGPVSVASARVLTTLIEREPTDAERGAGKTQLLDPPSERSSETELSEPAESARDRGSLSPSRPGWTRPSATLSLPEALERGAHASEHAAPPTALPGAPPSAMRFDAPLEADPRPSAAPPTELPGAAPLEAPVGAAYPDPPPVSGSVPLSGMHLSAPPAPRRRPLVWLAYFALGAGLSLAVAWGLGVFERRSLSPDSYVAQAKAALDAGHLSEPPHDNVRDLTDAALRHWPRHPGLLEVRRRAAVKALEEAQASLAVPATALTSGRLAVELDPDLEAARELVRQLNRQLEPPVAPQPPASASGEPPPRRLPLKPAASTAPGAPPSAAPSAAPSASPGEATEPPASPPAPSGGRWL